MFYFLKQYFLRFVTNISFKKYLLKTQYKILIYNELAISHNKVTFVIFTRYNQGIITNIKKDNMQSQYLVLIPTGYI